MNDDFVLGLKALKFVPSEHGMDLDGCKGVFDSPSQAGHFWPADALMMATHPGASHAVPYEPCQCGIWSTFEQGVVMGYAKSVEAAIFLIKGHPRFILGTKGFRAASAEVIAMVELPPIPIDVQVPVKPTVANPFPAGAVTTMKALQHPTHNLMGALGCEYFGVGAITLNVALEAIRLNNGRYGH